MSKKVWLITGCSRGLGRALAEAVLGAGHQLVATARDPISLNDLKEKYGNQVRLATVDVTNENDAGAAVQMAVDAFGKLDMLVNNAGYGTVNSIEERSLDDFRAEIETNLFGTIIMTKSVIPLMRKQAAGHIIQVSSIGGRIGPTGRAAYAAAKWGVEGFSETLSKEVGPLGIKVTIIEPGGFRTDFAGSSTSIREGLSAYDATVGATARFQRDYNGKQPGDPQKAATAIIQITEVDDPPLRLLLGTDAVTAAENYDRMKIEADVKWRYLSVSTDFDK